MKSNSDGYAIHSCVELSEIAAEDFDFGNGANVVVNETAIKIYDEPTIGLNDVVLGFKYNDQDFYEMMQPVSKHRHLRLTSANPFNFL